MIISPVVAYFYAQKEAPEMIWLLVLLSIPIFFIGLFGLYAFKTGWFGKKLALLDKGFVVLIGNRLIENLPQHRFLLFEERRLERLLAQVQQRIQEVRSIHEKLIQKSRELNENSSQLSLSMQHEQEQLRKVYTETGEILSTIRLHLKTFEEQRSMILNRAELEYIRNQARTLSQEEQSQFSQQALADLEVDSLFLSESIGNVEHELGRFGVHFELENELSR
jgi:cellobiose-specific phosphotransferase system component IIA